MRNYRFAIRAVDGTLHEDMGNMALRDDAEAQSFGQQVMREAMHGGNRYYHGWRMDITERERTVCSLLFCGAASSEIGDWYRSEMMKL